MNSEDSKLSRGPSTLGADQPDSTGESTGPTARTQAEMPPVTIDGYEDLELIGRGGYATVWRARQVSVGRQVALKVMDHVADHPETLSRFQAEIAALVEVAWNPNTVHIYDAGHTADGRPYLALEYMDGGSLGQLVRTQGPLTPAQMSAVGVAVSDALASAHRAGVLHRDIKPDNILVDRGGNPRLADFGIALVAGPSMSATAGAHSFRGTVLFSAPELLDGDPPSAATDIWGVGATLYLLCTGNAPFVATGDGDSLAGVIRRTLLDDPRPLPETIPPTLAATILQCLSKDPADRPDSVEALRDQLIDAARVDDINMEQTATLPPVPGSHGVDPASTGAASASADHSGAKVDAGLAGGTAPPTEDNAAPGASRHPARRALFATAAVAAVAAVVAGAWLLVDRDRSTTADGSPSETTAPVLSFHGRGPRGRADQLAMKTLGLTPEQMAERFDQESGPSSLVSITDGSIADTSPALSAKVDEFEKVSGSSLFAGQFSRLPRGFQDLGYSYTPVRFNHRAINKVLNDDCYEVFDDDLVMRGVAGALWTNDKMAITLTVMELADAADAEQFFAGSTMFFGLEPAECRGWPAGGLAINSTGLKVTRHDFPVSVDADQTYTAVGTRIKLDTGLVAESQYSVVARFGATVVAAQALAFDSSISREELRAAADEAVAYFQP